MRIKSERTKSIVSRSDIKWSQEKKTRHDRESMSESESPDRAK
jgi:hypothetical protein